MGRFLLSLLVVLLSFGCFKSNQDDTEPAVRILEPFEDATFLSGSPITFHFEATDDVDLFELNIRIHDNDFDHNESAPSWLFEWDTIFQHKIFGQQTDLLIDVPIPANLGSGPYHAVIESMDASGNRSPSRIVNFNIQSIGDEDGPAFQLDQEEITLVGGTVFFVTGIVTDETYVQTIEFRLIEVGTNVLHHESIHVVNTSSFDIQEFMPVPPSGAEYNLYITATDPHDNTTVLVIPVNVN